MKTSQLVNKKNLELAEEIPLDGQGNTPLHQAILSSTNFEAFIEAIQDYPKEKLFKMAKIVNNEGKLPISLLNIMSIDLQFQKEVTNYLVPLLHAQKIKTISDEIRVDNYVYANMLYGRLCTNLKLACQIANQVRKKITKSPTHLEMNNFSHEYLCELDGRIQKVRDKATCTPEFLKSYENKIFMIEKNTKHALAEGVGNCNEFSSAVFSELRKKNIFGEIFSIDNGDHKFVVVDRDPLSDPSNYKSWGKNAVICDAWAGLVYPVSELPKNLSAFYRYPEYSDYSKPIINISIGFNEQFHILKVYCQTMLYIQENSCPRAPSVVNMSMFSSNSSLVKSVSVESRSLEKELFDLCWTANDMDRIQQILITENLNINEPFFLGGTSLIRASLKGHVELVKILLEHGADPSIKSLTGTAYTLASSQDIRELLVSFSNHKENDNSLCRLQETIAFS